MPGAAAQQGAAAQPRLARLGLRQRVALLRIAFGAIWLVDGTLKLNSSFVRSFESQIRAAGQGQPHRLQWWSSFWANAVGTSPHAFAYLTVVIQLLTGLGLVLGFARRAGYSFAFLYSLALWAIPEGFGGPHMPASTGVGAGLIYAIVFAALYGLDTLAAEPAWTLDRLLERRLRFWRRIAEPAVAAPPLGTGASYAVTWREAGDSTDVHAGKLVVGGSGLLLAGSRHGRRVSEAVAYAELLSVERTYAAHERVNDCPAVRLDCASGRSLLLATPLAVSTLGEVAEVVSRHATDAARSESMRHSERVPEARLAVSESE